MCDSDIEIRWMSKLAGLLPASCIEQKRQPRRATHPLRDLAVGEARGASLVLAGQFLFCMSVVIGPGQVGLPAPGISFASVDSLLKLGWFKDFHRPGGRFDDVGEFTCEDGRVAGKYLSCRAERDGLFVG